MRLAGGGGGGSRQRMLRFLGTYLTDLYRSHLVREALTKRGGEVVPIVAAVRGVKTSKAMIKRCRVTGKGRIKLARAGKHHNTGYKAARHMRELGLRRLANPVEQKRIARKILSDIVRKR